MIFPGVWEFPILLVLALIALAVTVAPVAVLTRRRRGPIDLSPFFRGARARVLPYLAAAALLVVLLIRDNSLGAEAGFRWLLVGGLILLLGARPAFLAVSTGLVLALAVLVLQPAAVFRDRSFFGVTEVLRPAGTSRTELMNGTTVHGIQSTDPTLARRPAAYYAPAGPFGDVFDVLGADPGVRNVAAVGLGAGAVATYLQPGWSMTFFEIDPLVADVASDPRFFTYLSDAAERPAIVLGDARLSLRNVANSSFDAILVDAFSSDSIPTHLLTVEAVADYARVVKPGGIILVHTSNRYYDLGPAVAAAAGVNGMSTLERSYDPTEAEAAAGASVTAAVAMTRSEVNRNALTAAGWRQVTPTVPPMTDDFMDVLRFIRPLW